MFALMNPPHVKRKRKKPFYPLRLKPSDSFFDGMPSKSKLPSNMPRRKGRKVQKNSWFGNAAGHRAAAKKGWLKRKKKHGPKLKRASALITPGGGRIFSVAANPRPFWPRTSKVRSNSFMGINPYTSTTTGGHTMSRKRRGGRRARFNMGFTMPKHKGMFDAFKPNNLVGVMPILAGVIIDGIATKALSDKIPYTKKGIGNIVLGIGSAGLIGMLGRYANKALGDGLFVGGVVGTLGCAFQAFMQDGLKSLSLGEVNPHPWYEAGFQGMGTFVSPQQVSMAIPSEGTIAQYSLPNTNAQFQQLAPPQTPAQGHHARHMADYEGSAIGSVMGQDDTANLGM